MITTQEIRKLFQDVLAEIKNSSLRDKVVATWVSGCKAGGYGSVADLEQMPFTLETDSRGINFIEHTKAVTLGALALAKAQVETYRQMPYQIDFDSLVAGGLLHDVGKLLEVRPDGKGGYVKSHSGRCARHPMSGAILAAKEGIADEILNMIICHSKEGDGRPKRLETVFIHQADFATFDPLVLLKKGDLILQGED